MASFRQIVACRCILLLVLCSTTPSLVGGLPALPHSERRLARERPSYDDRPPLACGGGPCSLVGAEGAAEGRGARLMQVLRAQISLERRPAAKPGQHEVEHISLLNNNRFWWLMGAVVVCVGIAVIKMEVSDREVDASQPVVPKAEEEPSSYTLANAMHLCSCAVALNVAMLVWGVGQEFVMTNLYEDSLGNREKVPDTIFIVFCNRTVCVFFSGLIIFLHGRSIAFPGITLASLPAISNLVASWCQYQSLAYISFALQTTVKSAKLLPVVFVSSLRGKRHGMQDYAEVLVIAMALVIFGLETEGGDDEGVQRNTEYGLLLLAALLCCDSLTPHFQDHLFKARPELNAIQATFSMALVAAVLALLVLGVTCELRTCISFMVRNPASMLHIAVLSLASTLTQFLISHTIKHFGPVIFTLIATTRQAISVTISAAFFNHIISPLAVVAAVLLFGTVIVRGLRPLAGPRSFPGASPRGGGSTAEDLLVRARFDSDDSPRSPLDSPSIVGTMAKWSQHWQLFICAIGIHVLFCFYAMAQEFISIHTFTGQLFRFPLFLIAVNRTAGAIFALCLLKAQGLSASSSKMNMTLLPAVPNFLATVPQYQALYHLFFPAQVLMKSLKVLPVMLCGRLMKNRSYSRLDYAEGMVITVLVSFFVWDFQLHKGNLGNASVSESASGDLLQGCALMLCYILMDALTSNLEDYVYQAVQIDPAQQMFGIEVFSGIAAWGILMCTGELGKAVAFLWRHSDALQYVGLLAISSALGTYACTVTVRLFGPAVFTLLMVSRQILSLVISVLVFQHTVDWLCCFCLGAVSLLILTASMRQVSYQVQQSTDREKELEKEKKRMESIGANVEVLMKGEDPVDNTPCALTARSSPQGVERQGPS